MSEETIKRIEETLKLTELCQRTTNAPEISENYIWDMRTLLNLYNKEKSNNEELMQEYHKRVQEKLDLIYGNNILNKAEVEKHYIHKEKITILLQKLKDKEQELTDEQGYWGGSELQAKIEVLEKLLGDDTNE